MRPAKTIRHRLVRQTPLSRAEFVALMAMMFATIALSVDAMLPALPDIAEELSPDHPNAAQLVVASFILGLGIGTFFTGPLSDALGRRPVILGSGVVFCAGAVLAWASPSLETLLLGRLLQGIGASGPRVVALAIVRDIYQGRLMAQTMSFVMTVFTIVPALAPSLGAAIIAASGWRAVFAAFVVFSIIAMSWFALRQCETLPIRDRIPMRRETIWAAIREIFGNKLVLRATIIQALAFAIMFAMISSVQPIFDDVFGRHDSFPLWFALIALAAAAGSVINAKLVMRLGMRALVRGVLAVQVVLSGFTMLLTFADIWPPWLFFPAYLVWTASIFMMIAFCLSNMSAIAMEPLGHIAGIAASVIGSVATVAAVIIAVPIGLMFDGTVLPLATGVFVCSSLALAILQTIMQTERVSDTPP